MSKLVVYQRGYGCDTGCCGHTVEWFSDDVLANEDFSPHYCDGENKSDSGSNFQFGHPWRTDETGRLEWAKAFVAETYGEEHVKDLDWEHSFVTDDCE